MKGKVRALVRACPTRPLSSSRAYASALLMPPKLISPELALRLTSARVAIPQLIYQKEVDGNGAMGAFYARVFQFVVRAPTLLSLPLPAPALPSPVHSPTTPHSTHGLQDGLLLVPAGDDREMAVDAVLPTDAIKIGCDI